MENADAKTRTRSTPSTPSGGTARIAGHIEGIRQIDDEGALLGRVYILGVLHHAWFVQVQYRRGEQVAVKDPYHRLNDYYRLDAEIGAFQTVEVPGFPGEYVLVIYPGSK
jgi:hypothetical protein